jgi:hypothetical protein
MEAGRGAGDRLLTIVQMTGIRISITADARHLTGDPGLGVSIGPLSFLVIQQYQSLLYGPAEIG